MTRVKIASLKDNLSRHLRAVEAGQSIEVTDRSRPIAHIVPVANAGAAIRVLPAQASFASVRNRRFKPTRWRTRSLKVLIEDRRRR